MRKRIARWVWNTIQHPLIHIVPLRYRGSHSHWFKAWFNFHARLQQRIAGIENKEVML